MAIGPLPAHPGTDTARVAMISGGARGIGKAVVRQLLDNGFCVSMGVRSPSEAARVFGQDDPSRLLIHRFDALLPETATDWLDATIDRFGKIDALINNAGIWRALDFDSGDENVLDEILAVNVKAPFRLIRQALPWLRRSGRGRIINIGSTDGKRYRNTDTSIAYSVSKSALITLTHAARHAGWEDGIRVTAICPGGVRTDLLEAVPGASPAADLLEPETVAETVLFLLGLPNTASIAELIVNTRLEPTM